MVDKVNIVAEGDSWFAVPQTILPRLSFNILSQFYLLATKGSMQYRMIGRPHNRGGQPSVAEVGIIVCKHGRTTGYTQGIVSDIAYDVRMDMGATGVAVFEDQIRIEAEVNGYSESLRGGDSGSLLVNLKNEAIGLCFAGPRDGGSYGIANHIGDVLTLLGSDGVRYQIV